MSDPKQPKNGSPADSPKASGSKPKAKRGRPKGSKTNPQKPVRDAFDTQCPSCGKTGARIMPGNKSRIIPINKVVDGVTYDTLKVDTVQCCHCPQRYVRRTHGKNN